MTKNSILGIYRFQFCFSFLVTPSTILSRVYCKSNNCKLAFESHNCDMKTQNKLKPEMKPSKPQLSIHLCNILDGYCLMKTELEKQRGHHWYGNEDNDTDQSLLFIAVDKM